MDVERFWTRSWDPGVSDLDPELFETTLVDALRRAFSDFPDRAALSFLGVEVTFAALDGCANRFAHLLLERDCGRGTVVAINLPNIPEYVIAWLGALRAGCTVCGVSPLLSAAEMEFQLRDSAARVLVTLDAIHAARLPQIADRLPELELVVAASVGGFLPALKRLLGKLLGKIPHGRLTPLGGKQVMKFSDVIRPGSYPQEEPQVDVSPGDTAYLQYTGGTTGSPKGAVLSHRNVVADMLIVQHWLGWEPGQGAGLSCFPMFHIAGQFFATNLLYLGKTQILVPNPRDTDLVCRELRRWRPDVIANVPSLYHLLLANPAFSRLDHSRLEVCISSAAPFPAESQHELEKIIGPGKLLELYGMSETAPVTVMNPRRGRRKIGTIGLPLPNTDIRLVDPASGQAVEIGQPGEICVRGPMVMSGYHNRPEESARAIDGDGFLHTGDVAVFDDAGYLRLVDRTKDMIIVSGFKVFSKHVEEILAEHPAVGMIAVVGVPNPQRPGSELVKAFLTRNPAYRGDGDPAALRDALAEFAARRLAPYERPKSWEIVAELPLTAVGKVDKKALRQQARAAEPA